MKKHQKTSFTEIVQSAIDKPDRQKLRRLPPGRYENHLVMRDQSQWTIAAEAIDPVAAQHLVAAGAFLAHDPCGCGGTCGIELLSAGIAKQLSKIGSPEISNDPRHPGSLSYWTSDGDPTVALVLASGRVTWGHSLA